MSGNITTASGSKFYIGTTMALAGNSPASDYDDDTYQEVAPVEDFGEFGDESNAVKFAAVGDARVRTLKGARDAGVLALICGRDHLDTGQIAMRAAEATKYTYNFKVVLADRSTPAGTDTVMYFRGLVMSARDRVGQNDNVMRTVFNVAINSDIYEITGT